MGGRWDAIVVGAGVGGLVCAGYLAACGMRVLVVEQHDVAGGNAHVFRRRRAYQFDVGTHYLGDCGPDGVLPAVLSGLGVADRVDFHPMDPDGFDLVQTPSARLAVPTGWSRYGERLAAALPGEAAGLRAFLDAASAVAGATRRSAVDPRGGGGLAGMDPLALRWSRRPLARLFDHCGLSPRARVLLAAQLGNYGAFPDDTPVATHATMLDNYLRGAHYPAGGGQVLVAALVEAIEAHGGALWTRALTERITVEGGAVTGVLLADGRAPRAPVVVSNADYRRTVLELCPGAFPAPVVERTEAAEMTTGLAALYLALRGEESRPNANVWWWSTDDVDEARARVLAGTGDVPFAFLSYASLKDPVPGSACPPGQTNLQVMTLCPDEEHGGERYRRDPAYLAAKARLTEGLLDAAEAAVGPLRHRVLHAELATPTTHRRYTRSSGGTPYGLGRWGRTGFRPDTRTAVDGLFLAGQNTRFGSGITAAAVSGVACASAVLDRDLLPEARRGAVFATPALLPDRDADFDPLRVSRGLARRDARGLAGMTRRGARAGGPR